MALLGIPFLRVLLPLIHFSISASSQSKLGNVDIHYEVVIRLCVKSVTKNSVIHSVDFTPWHMFLFALWTASVNGSEVCASLGLTSCRGRQTNKYILSPWLWMSWIIVELGGDAGRAGM